MTSPQYLVFLGTAGSGKGTQAQKLDSLYGICQLSTGDLLREACQKNTSLGIKAKQYVESGDLVPDNLVLDIISQKINSSHLIDKGFILDGFPRNLDQAQELDELLLKSSIKITRVFLFDISLEKTISRLSGRRICPHCNTVYHIITKPAKKEGICDNCGEKLIKRIDDTEEKIRYRYEIYKEKTQPLIEYYQDKLIVVDGNRDPEAIFQDMKKYID